jgi:polyisoprenoid-binding protein YceI
MDFDTSHFDTSHSQITFSVRHMVVAKVHGRFDKWSGSLKLDDADLASSSVTVRIDATSINTQEPNRDNHLRSPDFFDVEQFPEITFVSKRVEKVYDSQLKVVGDLTLHGVTREVVLDTEYLGKAKDPWGNQRVAFTAKTTINRKDYGLNWNQLLEAGGVLVGEKIEIGIDVQAIVAAAQRAA